jgi:hypothetical protein
MLLLDEQVMFSDKLLLNIDCIFLGQSNPLICIVFLEHFATENETRDGVLDNCPASSDRPRLNTSLL